MAASINFLKHKNLFSKLGNSVLSNNRRWWSLVTCPTKVCHMRRIYGKYDMCSFREFQPDFRVIGQRNIMSSCGAPSMAGNETQVQFLCKVINITTRRPLSPFLCKHSLSGQFGNFCCYSTKDNEPENEISTKFRHGIFWLRNVIFEFLIRGYFDNDFRLNSFVEGAYQAFLVISKELSENNVDNLDGVLSDSLHSELSSTVRSMSNGDRSRLLTQGHDIVRLQPRNITVDYSKDGRKYLLILMMYICCKGGFPGTLSISLSSDEMKAEMEKLADASRNIYTCLYEFQREVTEGADPSWTVTHITHADLICTEARAVP